ncbi:MAG: hypothetical protein QNL91_07695, partial [Candidatus Krumholzibacteria bacterium]|nr:hypothetical protein [Candidatus Krumholzibacteria bacterium]
LGRMPEEIPMKKTCFTAAQIMGILRQMENDELCRGHSMSSATVYIYGCLSQPWLPGTTRPSAVIHAPRREWPQPVWTFERHWHQLAPLAGRAESRLSLQAQDGSVAT